MDVNPSSPAGESGLLLGDIIVGVNNAPMETVSELKDTIWWMGVTPVVFSVVRGGEDYIFTFPVG
jgi:S1-C subfamily serine protease